MQIEQENTPHQITIAGNALFSYTTQLVDIKNALGVVAAELTEYSIFQNSQLLFKLYKTQEGNWFEYPDTIPPYYTAITGSIKSSIDRELVAV